MQEKKTERQTEGVHQWEIYVLSVIFSWLNEMHASCPADQSNQLLNSEQTDTDKQVGKTGTRWAVMLNEENLNHVFTPLPHVDCNR